MHTSPIAYKWVVEAPKFRIASALNSETSRVTSLATHMVSQRDDVRIEACEFHTTERPPDYPSIYSSLLIMVDMAGIIINNEKNWTGNSRR